MTLRKCPTAFSAVLILILVTFYRLSSHHISTTLNAISTDSPTLSILDWHPNAPPRISIAAPYSPNPPPQSLASYASHFNHTLHIQPTPIVRGFANSLLWLHHVIASELMGKFGEERAEWIVYYDFSRTRVHSRSLARLLPSPSFPSLSTLTSIGTKSDGGDIDASFFYMRVSALSLRVLTLAMAAVYLEPWRDWGDDIVGAALGEVLGREEYRDKIVWVLGEWLDGEVSPSREEVEAFWLLVGEARMVLDAAKAKERGSEQVEFREEVRGLRNVVELRTWDIRAMMLATEMLKGKLGLGEIIGLEAKVGK